MTSRKVHDSTNSDMETFEKSNIISTEEEDESSEDIIAYRIRKRQNIFESDSSIDETKNAIPVKSIRRQTIWHANKDNNFTGNCPTFLGSNEIQISGETPYSYFNQIYTDDIFNHIVQETIRFSVDCGKDTFRTNISEMKQFFAINIVMTYIHYPNYRLYWSANSSLRLGIIADTMSLKRFEEIKKFMHYKNNHDIWKDCKDIFIKVRPILDMLSEKFEEATMPTEFQAIDEMIIPFKGRHRGKQYLKSKPKQWGFKVWVRASQDGYVSKFEMYQRLLSPSTEIGIIGDTVLRLAEGLENKNHKLFLDNLFTSIPTLLNLQSKGIYVVGTIRANRLKEANDKLIHPKILAKQGRGSISVVTSTDNITILRWSDNNIVHMISSYAGVEPKDFVQKWDRKEKKYVDVMRPFAVSEYNKFMGGVDLCDRMIAHYPHALKSKKFYHRIAFTFLNISIINAWILFKRDEKSDMSLLEFKASIACTMIQLCDSREKKRGRPSISTDELTPKKLKSWIKVEPDIRIDGVGHYPKKMNLKNALRCHDKICNKRTRYTCCKCNEPVCPECMENFHK